VSIKDKMAFKLLQQTQKTINEAMSVAQNLCHILRSPLLDDFGLSAALRDLLAEFADRWQIIATFSGDEPVPPLPSVTATALFRVAQEGLTNILKHSKASRVAVSLEATQEAVTLLIRDNGIGFNEAELKMIKGDRLGLFSMKERIEMLGGTFQVQSVSNQGTVLTAQVPLKGAVI
jgi:two-component system, NarL family, sensor kinase